MYSTVTPTCFWEGKTKTAVTEVVKPLQERVMRSPQASWLLGGVRLNHASHTFPRRKCTKYGNIAIQILLTFNNHHKCWHFFWYLLQLHNHVPLLVKSTERTFKWLINYRNMIHYSARSQKRGGTSTRLIQDYISSQRFCERGVI